MEDPNGHAVKVPFDSLIPTLTLTLTHILHPSPFTLHPSPFTLTLALTHTHTLTLTSHPHPNAVKVPTDELIATLRECLQLQDCIECIFLNLCETGHIADRIHTDFPHLYVVAWRTVVQDTVAQVRPRCTADLLPELN